MPFFNRIFNYLLTGITILTVNLLVIRVEAFVLGYRWKFTPYQSTIIGMLIMILVFFPLFGKFDYWINQLNKKLFRSGKKVFGKKLGTLTLLILAYFLLYCFYFKLWFGHFPKFHF